MVQRFNCAEIEFGNYQVCATRVGSKQRGSKIEIETPFLPAPTIIRQAEDPRLFIYRDKLHCSYSRQIDRQNTKTVVAELGNALEVKKQHDMVQLQPIEKNWGFFERSGRLYAVHDPAVFRVLEFENYRHRETHSTAGIQWGHGQARGSTPPVLHDGKLTMFFHSRPDYYSYFIGYCEFEPEPPFAVIRHSARAIELAEFHVYRIIFPGSAQREPRGWRLACGFDDKTNGIVHVSDSVIEESMHV